MSEDRVYLTEDQIRRLTVRLSSLTQKERQEVRGILSRLKGGGVSRYELHQALLDLRHQYVISENDLRQVEKAVFEE